MTDPFDAYHQWLGIPPDQQPPHHYRLLGLPIFEADVEKIRAEADRRMQHVRTFQLGKRSAASQAILNELAAARVCLLDPAWKVRYDAALADWLAARLPVPPPVVYVEAPPAAPTPAERPPMSPTSPRSTVATFAAARPVAARRRASRTGWYLVVGVVVFVTIVCGLTILTHRKPAKGMLGNLASQEPAVALPQSEETGEAQLGGRSVIVPENVVIQAETGDIELPLDRAALSGPALRLQNGATAGWSSAADRVEWELLVRKPGIFRINVTYAADSASAGSEAQFELSGRKQPFVMKIRDTGGQDQFVTEPVNAMVLIQRGGRYTLRISTLERHGDVLMTLKSVQLHREPVR